MREKQLSVSDTEEKILTAALKVINRETISGTRIHLIAKEADVAQSNVHYYYKTKQDLMDSLQERVLEECYDIRRSNVGDETLEGQLHTFFEQKKHLILKKRNYDFAELNFIIQSKLDVTMKKRFQKAYEEWRDDIREIIIRFYPMISEEDKEQIPYVIVSMLEGASLQVLIDADDFNADMYFGHAEKMALTYIYNAGKKEK